MNRPIIKVYDNGLKCCIFKKPDFVEKQAMVAFNYGSCDNEFIYDGALIKQPEGIAHFLEHKMFEDGQRDMFGEFTRLGATSNAYTNFTTTAYHFSTVDNFGEALGLLLDMTSSNYLTEDNIKKEKGIIAQEIKMYLDDPSWSLCFNTLKAAYTENRVRNNVAGTLESIESITRQDLELSYDAFYTYDNACVIVVGDVDENEVYELIEDRLRLGDSCAGKTISDDMPYKRRIYAPMPVDKAIFTIGYREEMGERDIVSRICLNNIIMTMLCSRGSRLTKRLTDSGITDEELKGQYLCSDSFGIRMFSGVGDKAEAVAELTDEEIDRHLHYGIRGSELKRISSMLRSELEATEDNISALTMLAADCFSKGIDILDIFEKYGTIDESELLGALSGYNCRVISIVGKE